MRELERKEGYFLITHYPSEESPIDIGFSPSPNGQGRAPEDQYQLKSDIEAFIVTLGEIYKPGSDDFNHYYQRVFYIAQLGLEGENIDNILANRTLEQLRGEIVVSAGATVRNKLLTTYGIGATICSALSGVLGVYFYKVPTDLLPLIPFFLLMISGSMIGSWLSLGVRTRSFRFDEMRLQIRDHSGPYVRLAFTGVLTVVTGLLMNIGALQISIGSLDSSNITTDPIISLTFGVLLGFSEKTLVSTLTEKTKGIVS